MKKKIFITDLIGKYCGMHYYDNAFKSLLEQYQYDVRILSNYTDAQSTFFPMIFRKQKIYSILLLIFSYIKFINFLFTHKKGNFIYLSYGELYDIPFLFISFFTPRIIIDVHEVYALKYSGKHIVSKIIKTLYRYAVHNIIYHSARTLNILQGIKYNGRKIYIEHLNYKFKKEYEISHISQDVLNSYQTDRLKFLFFGNLSKVKGIDIIIEIFSHLDNVSLEKIELVIAGKNVDAINFDTIRMRSNYIHIIDRHINDDELIYLYQKTDLILLPYRKSSQSGIAAMGIYFQKPMILSKIPYFEEIIHQCPSNSRIIDLQKYGEYIKEIINDSNKKNITKINLDINKEREKKYKDFISELKQFLK